MDKQNTEGFIGCKTNNIFLFYFTPCFNLAQMIFFFEAAIKSIRFFFIQRFYK